MYNPITPHAYNADDVREIMDAVNILTEQAMLLDFQKEDPKQSGGRAIQFIEALQAYRKNMPKELQNVFSGYRIDISKLERIAEEILEKQKA